MNIVVLTIVRMGMILKFIDSIPRVITKPHYERNWVIHNRYGCDYSKIHDLADEYEDKIKVLEHE